MAELQSVPARDVNTPPPRCATPLWEPPSTLPHQAGPVPPPLGATTAG